VKIKLILIFLITAFAFSASGQAAVDTLQHKISDSTRVKLEQYKRLLDDGTISEDEYNRKKAELLGTTQPETKQTEVVKPEKDITKADTMSMASLKERYKSKVIAGSVILSVGTAFWVGDVLLAATSKKLNPTDSLYSTKLETRRGSETALGVLGGLASVGGAVFLALGLKDKAVYRRRGKELTMNFTGKEIEMAFVF
jgi:hypothetical protein